MKQITPARLSGSTPARRCPTFLFLSVTFLIRSGNNMFVSGSIFMVLCMAYGPVLPSSLLKVFLFENHHYANLGAVSTCFSCHKSLLVPE